MFLLYWTESAIVGFYNIVKMIAVGRLDAIFSCIFFFFHYGLFMIVHLLFLLGIISGFKTSIPLQPQLKIYFSQINLGIFSLFLSHGVSFFKNFVIGKEYQTLTLNKLFGQPYSRIAIMHLTILFGGIITMALGNPVGVLILFVLIKLFADIISYQKVHNFNTTLSFNGQRIAN